MNGRPNLHVVDAAHDELKLTDVVLHAQETRGVVVEAEVQHHGLHQSWG